MKRETLVPSIPDVRSDNATDVLRAIKSTLDVREGRIGDSLDQYVTLRDLTDLNLVVGGGSSTLTNGSTVPVVIPGAGGDGYNPATDYTTPPAPTGLTASAGFSNVYLAWNGAPYRNHAYTEIWRATTDNLGGAVRVGTTISNVYADPANEASTYHYWIRFVSAADVVGPYNSTNGTSATTATNPGPVLDLLTGQITESQLFASLGERINLIDAQASITGSVNWRLAQEAAARTSSIAAEAAARSAAIQGEAETRAASILAEAASRISAISAEAVIRQQADQNEASARAQAIADEQSARAAAILAETQARADAVLAEAQTRQAAITTEQSVRQTADESLASQISTVSANLTTANSSLTAAIQSEATARATAVSAEADARDTLATQLRGTYAGTDITQVSTGLIYNERQSRITADSNLQNQINVLSAASSGDFGQLLAAIQEEQTARVNGDQANASSTSILTSRMDNLKDGAGNATNKTIEATISDNKDAQVDGDNALSTSISSLTSTVTNNYNTLSSAIQSEATTRATAVSAEATTRDALATQLRGAYSGADVDQVSAGLIYSERTSRVSADSNLQSQITSLSATVSNNNTTQTAAFQSEQTARIAGDTAEASSRETLATQLRGNYTGTNSASLSSGLLYNERQSRITAEGVISSSVSALSSTVSNNYSALNAAISSEATTRANADSALSSSFTSLTATVGTKNRTFYQSTPPTATSTGDLWFDTANNNRAKRWDGTAWVDTTDTRITQNSAAITTEQTARADADSALATSISQLTSTVTGNYSTLNSAITSEASTRSTADTTLTNSLDSLTSTVTSNKASTDAAIASEASTRATADSALSTSITQLTATFKGASLGLPLSQWALNGQSLVTLTDGTVGTEALRLSTSNGSYPNQGTYVAIDPTKKYRVKFWARPSSSANGLLYFSLRQFINDTGTACAINGGRSPYKPSGQNRAAHNAAYGTDAWGEYSYVWSASDWQTGVKFVQPEFLNNYNGTAGYWDIQGFTFTDATDIESNTAAIQTEATTRASADSALAEQITLLQSTVSDNLATLQNSYYTEAQTDSAISSATTTLVSTTALNSALSLYTNTATLQNNYYTKTQADFAISEASSTLTSNYQAADDATLAGMQSYVQNYAYSKSDADASVASQISTVAASVGAPSMFDSGYSAVFDTSNGGYSALGSTLTFSSSGYGYVTVTSSSSDPQITSPTISVDGKYTLVRARMRRTQGSGWQGTVYYTTSTHSFSESYQKTIAANPLPLNEWKIVEWDMSSLTAGGSDWLNSTITKLRFDFGSTANDVFEVDWISVGRQAPSAGAVAISTEANARASADSKLNAQYTVKIDNNGHVSGFGLASTNADADPRSAFIVRADRFAIAGPNDTTDPLGTLTPSRLPFIVTTTPTIINGKTYPSGTWIDTAFIANATITTAQINDLTADKITTGTLTAAISVNTGLIYGGVNPNEYALGSAYTGTGFLLGSYQGAYQLFAGSPTNHLLWNGTSLTVRGIVYASGGAIGSMVLDSNGLHSSNYASGSAGFAINNDGSMDINNGNFRGAINVKSASSGERMEITNGVIRVYDASGAVRVKIGNLA